MSIGLERTMEKYIVSRRLSSDRLYAYYKNRFWFWDEERCIWKESHLLSQRFEREHATRPTRTPETFMQDLTKFQPLDDYELDGTMLDALKDAKPCKTAPIEPVEETECEPDLSHGSIFPSNQEASQPATLSAPGGNVDSSSASGDAASASSTAPAARTEMQPTATGQPTVPGFDFGADDQTNALLLQDAQTFITGNMARIMAAKHAHDLTANHYQGSWGKWCAAVGISRDTGDRMVSVAAQCGNIELEGKSILEVQPLKLLYAAAKPSTPEVVKQAVFTGDITTYKEYQELLAQLKAKDDAIAAEKARADTAEAEREKARADQLSTAKDCNRLGLKADREKARADTAEAHLSAANADITGLTEQNAQLKEQVTAAEAREEEAWQMQSKAEARARNAEDALKKQPIVGVTDKEEVRRQAKALAHQWDEEELDKLAAEKAWGMADARNAELAKDNASLKKQLAQMRSQLNDNTQADFETANYCASLFRAAWDNSKAAYSRLTGEDLESAFQTLCGTLRSIMEEVALLCRQPAGYDGGVDNEPDV